LEQVKVAYGKNTIVRRIVRAFIANNFTEMTETDLHQCGNKRGDDKRLSIVNYDRWLTGRSAQYNIVIRKPGTSPAMYSLNIEVKNYLQI
jgi:nicotinamide riboside kinase